MYVEGIVMAIDEDKLKVKLQLPDYDDFITQWLVVPQRFCVGNKSRESLPKINSLVAAVLSDDMSHGACIGSLYNDEDTLPEEPASTDFIKYRDGTMLSHNEDSEAIDITVRNLNILGDVNMLQGNLTLNEGDITLANGNIDANGNIKDFKSTMQAMRDVYDTHNHTGNLGAATSAPNSQMS